MFSSDLLLLLLLSKGFGQQPKKKGSSRGFKCFAPWTKLAAAKRNVYATPPASQDLFLWHSEPRFQKGPDLVEIWAQNSHTSESLFFSKLLLIIYFPKGQEFLPFDKKMQNSHKSKSPSNTPRKKEAKKKTALSFSLSFSLRLSETVFLFLSFCNGF